MMNVDSGGVGDSMAVAQFLQRQQDYYGVLRTKVAGAFSFFSGWIGDSNRVARLVEVLIQQVDRISVDPEHTGIRPPEWLKIPKRKS